MHYYCTRFNIWGAGEAALETNANGYCMFAKQFCVKQ